jgi:ElaB/YqjD/DUF883 family membrane-anchored ribosome-binding protein
LVAGALFGDDLQEVSVARTNRDARKLQASLRSLQGDLESLMDDLGQVATNGKNVGLDKAKEQIDLIQQQIGDLVSGTVNGAQESTETVRRSVSEHPMTSVAAAFAAGVAAASLLIRR